MMEILKKKELIKLHCSKAQRILICTAEEVHIHLVGRSDPSDYSFLSSTLDLFKVSCP